MIEKLNSLRAYALKEISSASSLERLEELRIEFLGKKGSLSEILKGLGAIDPVRRPEIGNLANEIKKLIETKLNLSKLGLEELTLNHQLKLDALDTSAPSRVLHRGSLHPVTQTSRKIIKILSRIGFDVSLGPEIETEYLNFEAVNIPADHPARDMQDTFFLGPGVVLRTHTSPGQIRAMRSQPWPVRILSPGAVYRADSDATHTPMFHQIEGLWVDKDVRMSDLKGVLQFLAQELFGGETKIRFRPSYFPFVEPGAEVDVSCFQCRKKPIENCRVCKGTGWLEILGAGMVHPHLFKAAGYKSHEAKGFAFGMGVERIAMLLFQIPDLRLLFQGDVRFLNQF